MNAIAAMPRSAVVTPGVCSSYMPQSVISARSARRSSEPVFAVRNAVRLSALSSSSPSISTRTLHGSDPSTASSASIAASAAKIWPLLSVTPRA